MIDQSVEPSYKPPTLSASSSLAIFTKHPRISVPLGDDGKEIEREEYKLTVTASNESIPLNQRFWRRQIERAEAGTRIDSFEVVLAAPVVQAWQPEIDWVRKESWK